MKKRMAWLLIAALLLPAGCKKEELPVYSMEVWADGVEAPLVMDGVRYAADMDVVCPASVDQYPDRWVLTGERGPVIGVGGDPEKGSGGYDIYEITGDEERRFLYLQPNHFVFGPYYTFVCIREDVALAPPSAETAGRAVLEVEDREAREITDRIAALFAFYGACEGEPLSGSPPEERTSFTIRIYHRDYPFLSTQCRGTRKNETGEIYLACPDGEWRKFTAWEINF